MVRAADLIRSRPGFESRRAATSDARFVASNAISIHGDRRHAPPTFRGLPGVEPGAAVKSAARPLRDGPREVSASSATLHVARRTRRRRHGRRPERPSLRAHARPEHPAVGYGIGELTRPQVPQQALVPRLSQCRAMKAYQQETQLRTAGGLSVKDITEEVQEAVAASGIKNGICSVYSPHTTCSVRVNEFETRLPRGLRAAAQAARPERQLLRARRLGPPHRERLPRGHGLRQRPLALHVDAARPGRRVDPRLATASSASAPGSACSSSSSTASATAAGSSRSSASERK